MTYRFKQSVSSIVFKYFNEECPNFLKEVFDEKFIRIEFNLDINKHKPPVNVTHNKFF